MKQLYKFLQAGNVKAKEAYLYIVIGLSIYWQQVKPLFHSDNLNKIDKILRIFLTVLKLINTGD